MNITRFKNNDCFRPTERGLLFAPFMNSMMEDLIHSPVPERKFWEQDWLPAVNISETEKDYKVVLSIPGIPKESVKIEMENEILRVSGSRNEEKKETGEKFTRKEIFSGSFTRSFSLPKNLDGEKISANIDQGMLTILLPKKEEERAKAGREIKIS